jgi:DNA invertase Pin-like site-specific DNA recombinase
MDTGWTLGYARVSTDGQDLTAQTDALVALGVPAERVFSDKGMTGTRRDRPGLKAALAACRPGDTLVVTKLDRLARSLRDATDIAEELTKRSVRLNLGGSIYDPTDPVGRLLFNVLGMVAEFESDLIRARTREGWPRRRCGASSRGASRSSPPRRNATLSRYTAPATTRSPSLSSCSASDVPRSIEPSTVIQSQTHLISRSPACEVEGSTSRYAFQ